MAPGASASVPGSGDEALAAMIQQSIPEGVVLANSQAHTVGRPLEAAAPHGMGTLLPQQLPHISGPYGGSNTAGVSEGAPLRGVTPSDARQIPAEQPPAQPAPARAQADLSQSQAMGSGPSASTGSGLGSSWNSLARHRDEGTYGKALQVLISRHLPGKTCRCSSVC